MSGQLAISSLAASMTRLRLLGSRLAEPKPLRRLQVIVLAIVVGWSAASLARLVWSALPGAGEVTEAPRAMANPIAAIQVRRASDDVDLESMLGLGLFGDPSNETEQLQLEATAPSTGDREGIEQGAKETRLDLKLTGILASTEDGLGTVIIAAKGSQSNYVVGDKLPAAGTVSLAKVMAQQVVIDNNGTYELLLLFDDNEFTATTERELARQQSEAAVSPPEDVRVDTEDAVKLASDYRSQLYKNPDALRDLVRISPVREGGGLRGYRLFPGRDAEQFAQLGFERGDIVTAINGYSLADPSNTVRLYQLMRETTDATFEVERGGTMITVSISLNVLQ